MRLINYIAFALPLKANFQIPASLEFNTLNTSPTTCDALVTNLLCDKINLWEEIINS